MHSNRNVPAYLVCACYINGSVLSFLSTTVLHRLKFRNHHHSCHDLNFSPKSSALGNENQDKFWLMLENWNNRRKSGNICGKKVNILNIFHTSYFDHAQVTSMYNFQVSPVFYYWQCNRLHNDVVETKVSRWWAKVGNVALL